MTLVRATSILAALALVSGCVAVPAGPGYYRPNGYWAEPGYYYAPPVYYGPGIDLDFHRDWRDHDDRWHRR